MPTNDIYFYHPDHLGTSTYLTDANGQPYQMFMNKPFGETLVEQHSLTEDYETPFKFNGKELDSETGLYYYGARYYDPRTSIWLSVDPLAEKYPNDNPYIYCAQNPVNLIDMDGRSNGDPIGPGYYQANVNPRMIAFYLRHPVAASSIGTPTHGSENISTNAVRFSTRIGLEENQYHEGSQVNAFRHVLWQSEITAKFGSSIAKQVGNLHEENPFAATGSNFKTSFNTLIGADETIDLMNNTIGRQLGEYTKGEDMQFRALVVLAYYKLTGLWTATPQIKNGKISGYTISQTKISDEQYNNAINIIDGLNSNGFTCKEQAERDEAVRAAEATAAKINAKAMTEPKL